ncbi:MAG: calcium/sodium antiporter [Chitinispirillaceae bacterium]|nr:calcium/sodium antiporter [Chitinispirillaceae bacterium]
MLITSLVFILGLACLYYGAEWLVGASSRLALRLGISPLIVGLTVVAYGTSSPELMVSVNASLGGHGSIAVGNVIGSNIFNIACVLGASAMLFPIKITRHIIKIDIPIMIGASFVLLFILMDSHISRLEGALLFCGALLYTLSNIAIARRQREQSCEALHGKTAALSGSHLLKDIFCIIIGLGVLIFGSKALVWSAVVIAHHFIISETIIGLTIVAIGTGLPELAIALLAAKRKENDISTGNIVGSNIFNIFCILGIASMIMPIDCSSISVIDEWFMIGVSIVLLPFSITRFTLTRREGFALLVLYGAYLVYHGLQI